MKMKILIINGPNLNLLGKREPDVYGDTSFETYFSQLEQSFTSCDLFYFQSNHEGAIIDKIHETGFHGDLKVENMMQTLDGLFTWIDYGEYKTRAEGASSADPLTFLNGTQMTAAAADSLPFLSDPDLWRRIEADQKIEILQSMALNTYLRSFVQRLVPLHSGYEAS